MNYQIRTKIVHQVPILTAATYRAKLGQKNAHPTPQQIESSLLYYEKNLRIVQGCLKIMKVKMEKGRIREAFSLMNSSQKLEVNEEEKNFLRNKNFQDTQLERQFCHLIEEKIENQQIESRLFIEDIKQIYFQEEQQLIDKTWKIGFSLHKIANKNIHTAFHMIKQKKKKSPKSILTLKRTFVKNMVSTLNNSIIKQKQMAFRKLQELSLKLKLRQEQKIQLGLKQKGRKLLSLSFHLRNNLKSVFWRWYLNTTEKGEQTFAKAANNLVLYTNINKITAFYRLMTQMKEIKARIPPRVKRMATIVHVYSKFLFERSKRVAFDQFKLLSYKKKIIFADRLLIAAEMRKRSALGIWLRQANKRQIIVIKQKQKTESQVELQKLSKRKGLIGKQMIECSIRRKRSALQLWRNFTSGKREKEAVLKRILKMIGRRKVQNIKETIEKIKLMPDKKSGKGWEVKWNQFQKGLANYGYKVLRKCFSSFQHQYITGKNIKIRAIIQIMSNSKNKRQKVYNQWKQLIQTNKFINKCKLFPSIFDKINLSIKSVSDNAFISSNQTIIKFKILNKLSASFHSALKDSFARWRQVNRIYKITTLATKHQKGLMLKILEGLIVHNRQNKIRRLIRMFRKNWKVINYQRNFLKRVVQSKVGRISIALWAMRSVPQKSKKKLNIKGSIFEEGLRKFGKKVLKESFNSFKQQHEEGQKIKKMALIEMINCTMNKRKQIYIGWRNKIEGDRKMQKNRASQRLFNHLNLTIKSVVDYAFHKQQNQRDLILKQYVVKRLYASILSNLRETFVSWRQFNRLEKLKTQKSEQKKKFIIKLFETFISNNRKQKIRQAVGQFRRNFRIVTIQKNFLRRLLYSKSGITAIAFNTIRCLPNRVRGNKSILANIFQQGLSKFAQNSLKKIFYAFKEEYVEAQKIKKKALIKMIDCRMSKQRRKYNGWYDVIVRGKQRQKNKRVLQIMYRINNYVKSVTDLGFAFEDGKKSEKLKTLQKFLSKFPNQFKQSFNQWRQNNRRLKLIQIFKFPTHILSRNKLQEIVPLLAYKNVKVPKIIHKQYGLDGVQYLVKYILKLVRSHKEDLRQVLKRIKQIPEPSTRINPWFKRSVQILCLKTRINVQKSFWRMIQNSQSTGVTFNAAVIVKMKKMYNNIKKAYILNLYHAFLMIDRKAQQQQRQLELDYLDDDGDQEDFNGSFKSPRYDSFQDVQNNHSRSHNSRATDYKKDRLQIGNQQMILPQLTAQIYSQNCKRASVRSMGRVFNKFLKRRLKNWADIVNPIRKYNNLTKSDQKQSLYIARLGATQAMVKIASKLVLLLKQKTFNSILLYKVGLNYIQHHEENMGKISEFVQRHQLLLEQIKHYKQQYESASAEIQQKDQALKQADNMITVLSLRNNYIITHKFIITLQQVFNSVLERNFDGAFDAIMQQANKNFEKTVIHHEKK